MRGLFAGAIVLILGVLFIGGFAIAGCVELVYDLLLGAKFFGLRAAAVIIGIGYLIYRHHQKKQRKNWDFPELPMK